MGRRLPALLAALCVAAGAMAASASAAQLRGVALHPLDQDRSVPAISSEFAMLQAAGATSVRFDVYWAAVEGTGTGRYDRGTLWWVDWVMWQARAHGLKVILDVWATPCWASSAPANVDPEGCGSGWWKHPVTRYPPVDPRSYAEFAAFAAKRWGSYLAALELWNEPNGGFLVSAHPAREYATLVKAAYPAVKAVAPALPVIMSLGGTDTTFLGYLYQLGVAGFYDGIAVHPYNDPLFAGLKAFRAYQLRRGDRTPLWVTEVGWPASAYGLHGEAAHVYWGLRLLAALPYVSAAEIYELRDTGTDRASAEDTLGLLDRSLAPKPAWSAFRSALQFLATREANRTPSAHHHRDHRRRAVALMVVSGVDRVGADQIPAGGEAQPERQAPVRGASGQVLERPRAAARAS